MKRAWPLIAALLVPLGEARAGVEAPPIRFVTEIRPDVLRTLELLQSQQDLCRLEKEAQGQTVPVLSLPTAAQVAAHVSVRAEHLLDGSWEAVYGVQSILAPDRDMGCKIRIYRQYRADVAQVCGAGWGGGAAANWQGSQQEPETAPKLEAREDESAFYKTLPKNGLPKGVPTRCSTANPKKVEDTRALAMATTQAGVACVWWDGLMRRDLAAIGKPMADDDGGGLRACVHPTLYYYPVRKVLNGNELLALKHTVRLPKGTEPNPLTPQVDGDMDAVVWEQGKPIAAERFSRAAVQAFIQQPLWVDLGAKTP
jgi:hypothetical protein